MELTVKPCVGCTAGNEEAVIELCPKERGLPDLGLTCSVLCECGPVDTVTRLCGSYGHQGSVQADRAAIDATYHLPGIVCLYLLAEVARLRHLEQP